MVRELTATEVIDIAKQLEECGLAFYTEALKRVTNPTTRDVFNVLRADEDRHRGTFERLLGEACGFVEWRENTQYLEDLASFGHERVFPSVESVPELVAGLTSDREAVRLALKFERQTIEFLTSLRALVVEDAQSVLDSLIGEEHAHVVKLTMLLSRKEAQVSQPA